MAATLFISYAHKDEAFLHELLAYLQPLVDAALIDVWHDRRMIAGDDIFPSIEIAQGRARIVLLLVSESFISSVECAREMWRALERREKGRAVVVPVILRRCDWRAAPYAKLNALPTDGAPIDSAQDREQAYLDVVRGVRTLVERVAHAEAAARRRRFVFTGVAGLSALVASVAWIVLRRVPPQAPTDTQSLAPASTPVSTPPSASAPAAHPVPSSAPALASQNPAAISTPAGVLVIAEVAVTTPDGEAWNPDASGQWRMPNIILCFRQDAQHGQSAEICQPTLLGIRGARIIAHASAIHLADIYPTMDAWSQAFSVELKNQGAISTRVLGRGRCQVGAPCELRDPAVGNGQVVAEMLVLPARESTGELQQRYLERCVDPDSLLAQQWQSFIIAAGGKAPDLAGVSYAALAEVFIAVSRNSLTPGMVDAVVAGKGGFPRRTQGKFRGDVFRAIATSGQTAEWTPQFLASARRELAALKRNLGTPEVNELLRRGCR